MPNTGENVEQQEGLCVVGWSVKWYNYIGKRFGSS